MTEMPQFIEPHVIPEQLAADMARAIAEAEGCTPEEARHALDVVTDATEGAATPEEAAAAALAAAEQHDRAPFQVYDDGPPHPGPYRCPQTTSGVCAVRRGPGEASLTETPCKDTCGWNPHDDLDAPERDAEHDQAVPAAPPMPEQAPPVPMFAGTYAVYDDGQGGVWLVIGQSTGEVVRKHIPAGMIKMAERFGGAGSGLAGLFGGS